MTLSSLDHWCSVIPLKVIFFFVNNYSFSLLFQAIPQFPVEFPDWSPSTRRLIFLFIFFPMSTLRVRYIQSCVSPASQSVSQAHTPSRPFTCAHAATQWRAVGLRDAASVQGEGSGLLGPFSSTSDERGPSAQGPLAHTHARSHTYARASGHLRSVFVSLCCWRW